MSTSPQVLRIREINPSGTATFLPLIKDLSSPQMTVPQPYTTSLPQGRRYRYGFNGQESDDEVFEESGTSYTAEFWQYDTRLGRRWNIDPMFNEKPWMSSYHAFSDMPILNVDPNGANDTKYETEDGELITETDDGNDATVTIDKEHEEAFKADLNNGPVDRNSINNNAKWITNYASTIAIQECSPTTSEKEYKISAWALTAFMAGLGAEAIEESTGTYRIWRKSGTILSPKYYSSGWGGGSVSKIRTYQISKLGKKLTMTVVGVETVSNIYGVITYYREGEDAENAVSPEKALLEAGITTYGLYVNPPAAVMYEVLEVFYPGGAEGFFIDATESQARVNEITNYKVRLAPFGPK